MDRILQETIVRAACISASFHSIYANEDQFKSPWFLRRIIVPKLRLNVIFIMFVFD